MALPTVDDHLESALSEEETFALIHIRTKPKILSFFAEARGNAKLQAELWGEIAYDLFQELNFVRNCDSVKLIQVCTALA